MLAQILEFLVDSILGFFVFLLLARFHFQWLRISFRNQIGDFVIGLTNWIVMPARRVIPGLAGLDLPTWLAAWALQAATLAIVFTLRGHDLSAAPGAAVAGLFALAFVDLIRFSVYILIFALVVQAVLSWTNPHSPIGSTFDAIVRPFLRPIRRYVPPISNIDLSPLVLIIVLQVLLIPIAYGRAQVAAML
jgi:YggT family protein